MPHTTPALVLGRPVVAVLALALAAAIVALGAACDTEPLVSLPIDARDPEAFAPAPRDVDDVIDGDDQAAPDVPLVEGCGDVVIDDVGFIIDVIDHDGRLVVAATAGLFIEDGDGFTQIDSNIAWHVRSAGDSLIASTSTGFAWDDFTIARYDGPAFDKTVLLAPADLAALAAAHEPAATDGSTPHTVVADYVVVRSESGVDEIVFTANDISLIDHSGIGTPSDDFSHVFAMPFAGLDGALPTLRASAINAGAMVANDGELFFGDAWTIEHLASDGAQSTIYEAFDFSPQRMLRVGDDLYFTSGLNGAVVSVDKNSGAFIVYDASTTHWDAAVAVSDTHVYWSVSPFNGTDRAGVWRAPVGVDHITELVNDCIAHPDQLLVRGDALYVVSSDDVAPSLRRIVVPR